MVGRLRDALQESIEDAEQEREGCRWRAASAPEGSDYRAKYVSKHDYAQARTDALSALLDALAHQPILYCAENEVALTDHEDGGCGWCGSCRLDALLEGEDGNRG